MTSIKGSRRPNLDLPLRFVAGACGQPPLAADLSVAAGAAADHHSRRHLAPRTRTVMEFVVRELRAVAVAGAEAALLVPQGGEGVFPS